MLGKNVEAAAQDHGADVLGSGGFEEVGAAAGAVADVVTDEVGDDARVARIVLGNAGLDLADEVRAHVGGLGVDPAAELGEEGHEAGAEAVADDQERCVMRVLAAGESAVDGEDRPHTEQRQGDDQEAGDRAAAHSHLDRFDEAPAGGRGHADVRPDADQHADDPAGHRASGTHQERPARAEAQGPAVGRGIRDALSILEERDHHTDHDCANQGESTDSEVLALDEGDRALLDRRGDVHHFLGPGVARQDVMGEEDREPYRDQTRDRDEPLEHIWVHRGRAAPSLTGTGGALRDGALPGTRPGSDS